MLSEVWSEVRYRVRALLRRAAMERELDVELRFHIEQEADKYVRAGLAPAEALRRARLAFGGVDRAKEESREARGTHGLEILFRDLRFAARTAARSPAFTLAVVLTLAIGIGANTAIFTLVDALMLRRLPVPDPEALVIVGDPAAVNSGWHGSPETAFVSYPVYADVRDGDRLLSGLTASGAAWDLDVNVDPADESATEHPHARFVASNYFAVLGISPYAGRTFVPDGDRERTQEPAVVISYAYWQRRFAGERSVLGRTIRLEHVPMTIIGITPPSFTGDVVGESMDLWLPLMMEPILRPRTNLISDRSWSWLQMMGRLRPGVTLAQARAELSTLEAQSIRAHVAGVHLSRFEEDLKQAPIGVVSGTRGFSSSRDEYRSALEVLMAAVALVILVVCANIGNLMLSRASARRREMTVRMTLGAARRRLIQQLLTESTVLALAAAALGLAAAEWGSRLLMALAGSGDDRVVLDVAPDWRVLSFTAATALACVVLFGLVPAVQATRVDLATSLRAQGRGVSGGSLRPGRMSIGKMLVIAQVALSTLLLVGSGLLVRSMQRLLRVDLGMDRDHIVAVHVAANRTSYLGPRRVLLERELTERAARLPGVAEASVSEEGLFAGGSGGHVKVAGFVALADSEGQIDYDVVGPHFFRAIGAHIMEGRDFEPRDVASSAKVVAVDETMARYYWRGRDPIGGTVTLDDDRYTVVAVVHDVQERAIRDRPRRRMYIASRDTSSEPRSFELLVRTTREPARMVEPLRRMLATVDRAIPVTIEPLSERVRASVREDALLTQVAAFFAMITLVLAALGLYGLTSYSISRRTSELGLRIALGAEPGQVVRMVVRQGLALVAIGIVVGLPVGLAATRLIRGQLFGVGSIDLPSLSVAVMVLIGTALVASWIPAVRAGRIGPLEALRE